MEKDEPPGIRNHNPGNIRPGSMPWRGQTGVDNGYCVFSNAAFGIRALVHNLRAYNESHQLDTVEGVIRRWAPSSENNTEAYIGSVSHRLGVARDTHLDMKNADLLIKLTTAIIWHENGQCPYGDAFIANVVKNTLNE